MSKQSVDQNTLALNRAASDLLAACEAAEETLVALGQEDGDLIAGEGRTGLGVIFQLRQAIKKARGRGIR